MSNIVIIGAGQSGRGYINRLFYLSKEEVIFLDKDKYLIEKLNKEQKYEVSFGKQGRDTIIIDNFKAYWMEDKQAINALANADIIFISIGASHLIELLPILQDSLNVRNHKTVNIITAENGIHPSSVLSALQKDKRVHLSESIIFCTTLQKGESLDILSEDLDHLPYDITKLQSKLPYKGMIAEYNFSDLLERKIYTYNCISACIAYLGYVKGIENYAEAANEVGIEKCIHRIENSLNHSISKKYKIPLEEQKAFSNMAIKKFKNYDIVDTVARNVRDVERKLKEDERLLAPLRIMCEYKQDCEDLLYVIACALYYGIDTYCFTANEQDVLKFLQTLSKEQQTIVFNHVKDLLSNVR